MAKYSKQEQETIVNYNREDEMASVFTRVPKDINKLQKLGFEPTEITEDGGYTFEVPKSTVQFRLSRKGIGREITNEERDEIRARLVAGKAAKTKATKKTAKPAAKVAAKPVAAPAKPAAKVAAPVAKPVAKTAKKAVEVAVEDDEIIDDTEAAEEEAPVAPTRKAPVTVHKAK